MKKIIFTLLSCAALILASCDKIDEQNYIIYSGAVGEWFDGNGVTDHSQRAIIEKYTGVRCVNCPTADEAINSALTQYNGKLLAVAIHDSGAFGKPYSGNPDLRTDAGDDWSHYFGVFAAGQYPTALVNRTTASSGWDLFNPISGINSHVDPIVNSDADVAIEVAAVDNQDDITITVNLEFLNKVSDQLNVTLFFIEDGIVAAQSLPDGSKDNEYVHNHVLRDVITDVWGAEVDCTGAVGEKRMAQFDYHNVNHSLNISNCHIVALLSNRTTRQILNVAETEIKIAK